jgi:nicotinate-nucleotide adenylyltransferase
MERLGFFGGTFDPPHVGHLALAEWAKARLGLDRVLFVPSGRPPHKSRARLSNAAARLAMIRLAVRGNDGFEVSTIELRARRPSYTVDTLRHLHAEQPGARWYLVIGADSLDEFHTWHEPEAILSLATLAVATRPGAESRSSTAARSHRRSSPRPGRRVIAAGHANGRVVWLGNPGLDVSSTLVRDRARRGLTVRYLVPEAVAAYLARHRLYRPRARPARSK